MLTFRPRPQTLGVMLHASFTDPRLPNLMSHLAVRGRQMGLLEVGYHYVILPDGKLVGCRPDETMGAHCFGYNHTHIGVCLAGGVVDSSLHPEAEYSDIVEEVGNFTPDQGQALRDLLDFLHYRWPGIPLIGHSEARPRHPHMCPPMNMEDVRAWVE